jgi:hypothetical protein
MGTKFPSIIIAFKSTSVSAIERSSRGIVAMILKETNMTVAGKLVAPISTNFVAGDTLTFDGITFTATTSTSDATHFAVGADVATTATNIATALSANTTIAGTYTVTATTGTLTITEKTAGGGNTPAAFATAGTGTITTTSTTTSYSFATPLLVYDTTDIPDDLSDSNKQQIELALMGYQTAPKHILCYVQESDTKGYDATLLELEHARWDYLVIPEIATSDIQTIATWIKTLRTTKDKKVKAVLPNCAADNEGVINFTNTKIVTADGTFTAAQYCSRIAGIICGTPMTISCTFAPLSEVLDCDKYTLDQMNTKISNGELFVMYDGEKFKIARGVNSFVTTAEDKGIDFKKIKLVDAMDMIHDDIKDTANDSYTGKYTNSYDNKCLLITAIQGYFDTLETEGILDPDNDNSCEINLTSQKNYLISNGDYTGTELAAMKDLAIKELNTRDQVFLSASIKILDAIEDIDLEITI